MLTPSTGIPALPDPDDRDPAKARKFRLMPAEATDVVWDWNLITDALQFSPSVRTVFLYGPDEPVDDFAWWTSHIHADERDDVVAGIRRAIAGRGQFWAAEYRYLRGDGTYAHVFDRGFISRDGAGNPVRMMGSMFDVTDRKVAE